MKTSSTESNDPVEEYYKKQAEILQKVPEEFRGALSVMAYERGHSSGHSEVLMILELLISELKKPIEDYGNKIHNLYRV